MSTARMCRGRGTRWVKGAYDPSVTRAPLHPGRSYRAKRTFSHVDHMKPMRPVAARAVLQLTDDVTFTGADFSIQHNGVCRMNPELARRVAQLAMKHCRS